MKAKIEIRIWSDEEKQPPTEELVETFRPHVEHVSGMLARGFQSGDICDDNFRGWWEIVS